MTGLILRPVRTTDEDVVRAAHAAMTAEAFGFALGLRDEMAFDAWVEALADDGAGLDFAPHVWVPSTFLLAEVDGEVVGRTSVRHRLNDWLAVEGGHIGYGVLAAHRRGGYATEMLRQSLVVAREHGVDRVGPDIHELLAVVEDLRQVVTGLPGIGFLRRRGDDEPPTS